MKSLIFVAGRGLVRTGTRSRDFLIARFDPFLTRSSDPKKRDKKKEKKSSEDEEEEEEEEEEEVIRGRRTKAG
jgi:hypothetical protein